MGNPGRGSSTLAPGAASTVIMTSMAWLQPEVMTMSAAVTS
jgi:hypothetical protein